MSKKNNGTRDLTVRVRTARKRSSSSTRWLQRQLNDPYVQQAKREGYRSRAAYKLLELDERLHFLSPGQRVIDLGAAPGGWTQVLVEAIKPDETGGLVLAVDLQAMEPVAGAQCLMQDFMAEEAPRILMEKLSGKADLVLSDMAPASCGHAPTDHIRIMALCEAAYLFACDVLNPGGVFVCKVLQGGTEQVLLADMKMRFSKVRHAKPNASRKDSAEAYVIASGFRP